MSLEPSLSIYNVVRAELKHMEEIGNVQGPGKNVVRAEMSLVPRSLEASSTVKLWLISTHISRFFEIGWKMTKLSLKRVFFSTKISQA